MRTTRTRHAVPVSLCLLLGMSQAALGQATPEERALSVAREMLIDTHIDVPYRVNDRWVDVATATANGEFDFPRASEGGLDVTFMSIYTPPSTEKENGDASESFQLANQLIDSVEALAGRAPEKFMLVYSPADAEQARQSGRVGLALGMENGSPVNNDLGNLRFFADRGVRYITLTHGKSNHISDSSYDDNRRWGGLSPFGKEVVGEMNRLGIMIDISHVTDDAFYQVLELSKVPVIASHSSPRHFTPGWERNMSDDMIKALAAKGGVIQVAFGSGFLTQKARQWRDDMDAARTAWLEANQLEGDHEAARRFEQEYRAEHPYPYATMDDVMAAFEHVIELVGPEHVGFGSDFDGVGDSLPVGLKDVSDYPALIAAFLRRGYSEDVVRGIMGGNLLRVWREVEAYAAAP